MSRETSSKNTEVLIEEKHRLEMADRQTVEDVTKDYGCRKLAEVLLETDFSNE